jgi:hypothetical protein
MGLLNLLIHVRACYISTILCQSSCDSCLADPLEFGYLRSYHSACVVDACMFPFDVRVF